MSIANKKVNDITIAPRKSTAASRKKKAPSTLESNDDLYAGMHPELAKIARTQGAKPYKYDPKLIPAFLRDPKTWDGFEEYIYGLRHQKSGTGKPKK